ncbi:MAG: SDR family NAD(P)-dependent oxidoreductase, partial [Anaerolineales bacterium]
EKGGGVVINLVTVAGRDESPMRAAFYASMAGLEALSQQAAREFESYGIRVYHVPSDTPTETILNLCRSSS